jgi:hypothetical protein
MDEKYLGDSYDFVKRFLGEALRPIAKLYAHPKFVPAELREKYTRVTAIPMYCDGQQNKFGILLDPDTGIAIRGATRRHTSLQFIVELTKEIDPEYIVCYDQSYYRKHDLDREGQRREKLKFLREHNLLSFYYVSHAPFLFVARDRGVLDSVFQCLTGAGVPECRMERC